MMTLPDLEYNQFGFRIARTIDLNETSVARPSQRATGRPGTR
jgi:hypothetical protein